MITVADAVAEIVKQTPLLEEGLSRNLMNISAVARDIKSRVEKRTFKKVTEGAIVMALQRQLTSFSSPDASQNVSHGVPDMIIRSNLFEYTVTNSPELFDKQRQLLALAAIHGNQHFQTITSGVFETTVVASNALRKEIHAVLGDEVIVGEILDLASVTIRLTEEVVARPGFYAQILKTIAWDGINVIEVVSTYLELTIIIQQKDVDRTFSVLKNTFSQV